MELLNVGDSGYGQNYGFILYRTHFLKGSQLKFSNPVQDRAQVCLTFLVQPPWLSGLDSNYLALLVPKSFQDCMFETRSVCI